MIAMSLLWRMEEVSLSCHSLNLRTGSRHLNGFNGLDTFVLGVVLRIDRFVRTFAFFLPAAVFRNPLSEPSVAQTREMGIGRVLGTCDGCVYE
jgi:hypothetical protein